MPTINNEKENPLTDQEIEDLKNIWKKTMPKQQQKPLKDMLKNIWKEHKKIKRNKPFFKSSPQKPDTQYKGIRCPGIWKDYFEIKNFRPLFPIKE